MTALSGPILFNATSGGSDTAASGCGPATAVSVMIQTSAGSNTATASPTTGYSQGDLMYVPSFTGRKFNVIASVGSGSLTFDDNWDDSSFGTSAYVGGKRATFDNADSRTAFTDLTSVIIETETDQTINSTIFLGQSLSNVVKGSDGTQVITGTHNSPHFNGKNIFIADLTFATSNSTNTSTAAYQSYNGNNKMYAKNLTIDGLAYGGSSNASACSHLWYACKATNITNYAIQRLSGNMYAEMTQCYVDTASGAINWGNGTNRGCRLHNNLIVNCSSNVLTATPVPSEMVMYGNIFANGASNCINVNASNDQPQIAYNIFASNSGYAFNSTIDPSKASGIYSNAYYSNSSGNTSTGSVESDAITLTADPFVDAANGDFNLNNNLGGGSVLRSTKYTLGG